MPVEQAPFLQLDAPLRPIPANDTALQQTSPPVQSAALAQLRAMPLHVVVEAWHTCDEDAPPAVPPPPGMPPASGTQQTSDFVQVLPPQVVGALPSLEPDDASSIDSMPPSWSTDS